MFIKIQLENKDQKSYRNNCRTMVKISYYCEKQMNIIIGYIKSIKRPIFKFAWTLVGLGCLVISYLCVRSFFYTWIWGGELDFALTGQVGDFIGGVAGTFFALSGTLLIFLSFKEQTKQNKREAFEEGTEKVL